jgi:hypothetical protein
VTEALAGLQTTPKSKAAGPTLTVFMTVLTCGVGVVESVTVNLTVNGVETVAVKAWVGFAWVEVPPSPKSQAYV